VCWVLRGPPHTSLESAGCWSYLLPRGLRPRARASRRNSNRGSCIAPARRPSTSWRAWSILKSAPREHRNVVREWCGRSAWLGARPRTGRAASAGAGTAGQVVLRRRASDRPTHLCSSLAALRRRQHDHRALDHSRNPAAAGLGRSPSGRPRSRVSPSGPGDSVTRDSRLRTVAGPDHAETRGLVKKSSERRNSRRHPGPSVLGRPEHGVPAGWVMARPAALGRVVAARKPEVVNVAAAAFPPAEAPSYLSRPFVIDDSVRSILRPKAGSGGTPRRGPVPRLDFAKPPGPRPAGRPGAPASGDLGATPRPRGSRATLRSAGCRAGCGWRAVCQQVEADLLDQYRIDPRTPDVRVPGFLIQASPRPA